MISTVYPTTAVASGISGPTEAGATAKEVTPVTDPSLDEAARQFDAVLLRVMLKPLQSTGNMGGGGGSGGSVYSSMIVDALADAIANAGGLGLASVLQQSFETAPKEPDPESP